MKRLILALCFMGTSQAMHVRRSLFATKPLGRPFSVGGHVRQTVVGNIIKRWTALNGVSKFILPTASKDQKKRIAQMYLEVAHDAHRCNLKDIGEHADTKAVNLLEECDDEDNK